VASLTSEGVFLMGGSSGAIMTHNVAFNAINDGTTGNLEGIVIVDGVSAKRVCNNGVIGTGCNPDSDATGLNSDKSWTLPTLMLYAACDETIPTVYKERFADDLKRSSGTVHADEVGNTHSGDAWIQGTYHIIDGIRRVLPQLNLSPFNFDMPERDECPN
jgi:predicted esterase